jgi:hypothetical protein
MSPSRPTKGRSRSSRNAGRDAMDAWAPLTNGPRRGRRSRVVPTPRRWRQIGGISRRRRWLTSTDTGESTKETVKTVARGMPGDSGVTVVTMLVCFPSFAYEAAGASSVRHSLRPQVQRIKGSCITRAKPGRGSACAYPSVIARSVATKQSISSSLVLSDGLLRCARNDGAHPPPSSPRKRGPITTARSLTHARPALRSCSECPSSR